MAEQTSMPGRRWTPVRPTRAAPGLGTMMGSDGGGFPPDAGSDGGTAVPTDALAWYPFNEGMGSTTVDASGHGYTATLQPGVTWIPGRHDAGLPGDHALQFDGDGGFVLTTITGTFSGSMTVTAWINRRIAKPDDEAIFSRKGQMNEDGVQLDTTIDTGVRVVGYKFGLPDGGDFIRYGSTILALDTWYHVAGVYNASNQTLDVYVNGQKDNGVLEGTVPAAQTDSSLPFDIGQRPGSPYYYNFCGALDDIRVYQRALTPAEIGAIYAQP